MELLFEGEFLLDDIQKQFDAIWNGLFLPLFPAHPSLIFRRRQFIFLLKTRGKIRRASEAACQGDFGHGPVPGNQHFFARSRRRPCTYSIGAFPVSFLNTRAKWDAERCAALAMLSIVILSSRCA